MSSKKASFESRDPSYTVPDTDRNRLTADSKGASVDWATGAKPTPEKGLTAPHDAPENDREETGRASFYSRDSHNGNSAEKDTIYKGKERRKIDRRSAKERRTDVRFEVDKNDRRQNTARRKTDFTPKYW